MVVRPIRTYPITYLYFWFFAPGRKGCPIGLGSLTARADQSPCKCVYLLVYCSLPLILPLRVRVGLNSPMSDGREWIYLDNLFVTSALFTGVSGSWHGKEQKEISLNLVCLSYQISAPPGSRLVVWSCWILRNYFDKYNLETLRNDCLPVNLLRVILHGRRGVHRLTPAGLSHCSIFGMPTKRGYVSPNKNFINILL